MKASSSVSPGRTSSYRRQDPANTCNLRTSRMILLSLGFYTHILLCFTQACYTCSVQLLLFLDKEGGHLKAVRLQGVGAAKKAWKGKNAPPAPLTKNDAKAQRPTGRGDGGRGANSGGRRGGPARGGPGRLARGGATNANHTRTIADAQGGGKSWLSSDKAFWMGLVKLLDKK